MTNLDKLKSTYTKARHCYYNGAPILTDQEFDSLEDKLKALDPKWLKAQRTGTVLGTKVVTALFCPMPSLDKARAEETKEVRLAVSRLCKYSTDGVIMPKLDGASVQGVYLKGKLVHLLTRGNGIMGKSITHLIPCLNLPKEIDTDLEKLVVRFECLMSRKAFDESWSGVFDSPRAVANGLLNRQSHHPAMADLDFVAIRVLHPAYSLASGLEYLESIGFLAVKHRKTRLPQTLSELTNFTSSLSRLLTYLDDRHPYLVDGLVVHSAANKLPEDSDDKPKYAFAFKRNDLKLAATTTVRSVRWTISPYGVLVPTAIFDPVHLNDTTVTKAVMHNASWALTRGVGPGAVVKILKSGDIIPKIVAVVKRTKLNLPDNTYGEYDWDETGVCLVLKDKDAVPEVIAAKLRRFFDHMEVEGFSSSMAVKLVEAGYDTIPKILRMTASKFRTLPGIKDSAVKLANTVNALRETEHEPHKLLTGSGVFESGIGPKKAKLLFNTFPSILKVSAIGSKGEEKLTKVLGPATAKTLVEGWPKFAAFLQKTGLKYSIPTKTVKDTVEGPCSGLFGTWTGYRSKEEEEMFYRLGGTVVNYGAKTNVLFYLAKGKPSSKVKKATDSGVLVCSTAQSFMAQRCAQFKARSK